MSKYFGNHLGIVVNTLDPEKRGRVQVFVPNITPTLYKDWNETAKNKSFKTFDSNSFSEKIKERLQTHLPWAEAAVPFWGGSTGAPINQSYGTPTPMPTDQNFDYQGTSNPIPGVLAQTGNTGRVFGAGGGYHLDVRWGGDKYGDQITTADIDKYILVDGKSPSSYEITSNYGDQESFRSKPHKGIDFATPGGSNIQLINGATYGSSGWDDGGGGYVVSINLPDGRSMSLLHLQEGSINPNYGKDASSVPTEAYTDNRNAEIDLLASPLGEPTGETISVGEGYVGSDLMALNSNILKYLASIANFESSFNVNEAYSERYNQESNNSNVREYGKTLGSDYGFYQVNGLNVQEANSWGISNLNTGTFAQQTVAVAAYLQKKFPSVYAAAESGDFATANSIAINSKGDTIKEFWFGLQKDPNGNYANSVDVGKFIETINTVDSNPNLTSAQSAALASQVTNGQNVVRTRVPDAYGSLAGPRTGGTMGFNSVPHVGSKVWVFFMGGDVQKPVYFATIYEPNNIA